MEELKNYIKDTFDIDEAKFLEILKTNPNARQNIYGILGEMLFKDYINNKGYDALRIKEKPEGGDNAKNEDARGDFYIKKKDNKNEEWYVVECKSVKSNSEKRLGYTERDKCLRILNSFSIERAKTVEKIYKSGIVAYERAKATWEKENNGTFPAFNWLKNNPGSFIPDLTGIWESEADIKAWLDKFPDDSFTEDAYWNLTSPIRLLQTHMPSTRVDPETGIKSTGPLVTEFNILCVNLILKTGKHQFVFANSEQLNHQRESPNHLQQNYNIDILVEADGFQLHKLQEPWYTDLDECIAKTNPKPRKLDESQLDKR